MVLTRGVREAQRHEAAPHKRSSMHIGRVGLKQPSAQPYCCDASPVLRVLHRHSALHQSTALHNPMLLGTHICGGVDVSARTNQQFGLVLESTLARDVQGPQAALGSTC